MGGYRFRFHACLSRPRRQRNSQSETRNNTAAQGVAECLDEALTRGAKSAFQASTSSASQAELRAGYLVAGRYELKRVLGRGSMGTVWLANHKALDEEVAVKLLAPAGELTGIENASTTAALFRFEAQVAARLSRKTRHVVRVTDHGHDGALAFLVMERLEGQTLERALSNRGPM